MAGITARLQGGKVAGTTVHGVFRIQLCCVTYVCGPCQASLRSASPEGHWRGLSGLHGAWVLVCAWHCAVLSHLHELRVRRRFHTPRFDVDRVGGHLSGFTGILGSCDRWVTAVVTAPSLTGFHRTTSLCDVTWDM